MKNLNESLLESIDLIQESTLESELEVMFAIGGEYAKIGMLMEYADESVVNEFAIIQEATLFQELSTGEKKPVQIEDKSAKKDDESLIKKILNKIKGFFTFIGNMIKKAFTWIGEKLKKLGEWIKGLFVKGDKDSNSSKAAESMEKTAKGLESHMSSDEEKVKEWVNSEEYKSSVKWWKDYMESKEYKDYLNSLDHKHQEKMKEQFNAVNQAARELDDFDWEHREYENNKDYKTIPMEERKAADDKLIKILKKYKQALSTVLDKTNGAIGSMTRGSSANYETFMDVAKTVYANKIQKDKRLSTALTNFAKHPKLGNNGKFDLEKLFFVDNKFGKFINSYVVTLDNGSYIYGIEFTGGYVRRSLALVKESVRKGHFYDFSKMIDENGNVSYNNTDESSGITELMNYIEKCKGDIVNNYHNFHDSKELEEYSKVIENEYIPAISKATSEMMAFQRFVYDVYAAYKKKVA